MAQTITKTFYDVEHDGDAQEIYDILNEHKAKIVHRTFNYDAEQLEVTFEIEDYKVFKEAVKDEYWFGGN